MADPAVIYFERQPPAALRPFVHCYWRFVAPQDDTPQPIIPDGRPELIIHLGTPYREADHHAPQPNIIFAGQLTKPLTLLSDGPTDIVAVRFRPDGAKAILGTPLHHATNQRVDMAAQPQITALSALEPIWQAPDDDARFAIFTDVIASATQTITPDPFVRRGVDRIMDGKPHDPPSDINIRQYQRRFKSEVGISARDLQSIRRFRSVFDQIKDDQGGNWTQRALDAGYFDHPQMARDFRRFLGCSARQWVTQTTGLARKLSEAPG